VRKDEVSTDDVLAMIIVGKLPGELSKSELADLHG
jgi:hypothetical protein